MATSNKQDQGSVAKMDIATLRDMMRSVTLGVEHTFKKEIVEIDGVKFELRQPTVAQRSAIMRKAAATFSTRVNDDKGRNKDDDEADIGGLQVDVGAMQIWAVIYCTFVPGTNTNAFTEEDYDVLANLPTGSFLDTFAQKVMALLNAPSKKISPKNLENGPNASA